MTIVLVTENLADVSSRVVRSPQTVEIEVERPDEAERLMFLRAARDAEWFKARSELPVERLAQLTSGLTRIQLRQILSSVDERGGTLDPQALREQKKAVIEAECYGLLEYVESRFGLDMVSGHEGVKARLRRASEAVLAGRLRGVPMGYLIAGPVGSAKTFLVNCFTGELGFPCVKFLNFRSQWQGVTEGNLEKILKLLHAMWPVGVIIDEADAFLGDRNQEGDSGTSNRVFAQLASFMGNTEYRGKIVWFLITSRPDLLPVDLKRQGRAEEHLALFYPQNDEEHDALFHIMIKKSGLKTPATVDQGGDRRSRAACRARTSRRSSRARCSWRTRRRRRTGRLRRDAAPDVRGLHSGDEPARAGAADSRRRPGVHVARGAAGAVSRDGSRRGAGPCQRAARPAED